VPCTALSLIITKERRLKNTGKIASTVKTQKKGSGLECKNESTERVSADDSSAAAGQHFGIN
jgi:hypothetical protein